MTTLLNARQKQSKQGHDALFTPTPLLHHLEPLRQPHGPCTSTSARRGVLLGSDDVGQPPPESGHIWRGDRPASMRPNWGLPTRADRHLFRIQQIQTLRLASATGRSGCGRGNLQHPERSPPNWPVVRPRE